MEKDEQREGSLVGFLIVGAVFIILGIALTCVYYFRGAEEMPPRGEQAAWDFLSYFFPILAGGAGGAALYFGKRFERSAFVCSFFLLLAGLSAYAYARFSVPEGIVLAIGFVITMLIILFTIYIWRKGFSTKNGSVLAGLLFLLVAWATYSIAVANRVARIPQPTSGVTNTSEKTPVSPATGN